jgi:hypothetical protein
MKNSNAQFHIARPRGIFAAFVLASAMGSAPGQTLTAPAAPAIFTARDEQSLFLVPPAVRAHGYICLRTAAGAATASWAVEPSRLEATRFEHVFGQDIQIATDALSTDANPNEAAPTSLPFSSATWQSSFNPSQIWAQVLPSTVFPRDPIS